MNHMNLREQLLRLIRSWPILIAVILASSLLGWGAMHLCPPRTAASADLYIGLQIDRVLDISSLAAYAKTEPLNVDDYKNWQLSQFETVASSKETAAMTLEALQDQVPAWKDITPEEFQEKSSLAWYDAGRWRLYYRAEEAEPALQAVQAWREVLQEKMSLYLDQAQAAYALEGELRALDASSADRKTRILELEDFRENLPELYRILEDRDPGSPLETEKRQTLLAAVGSAASLDPIWTRVLDDFPPESAPSFAYLTWLELADRAAEAELAENMDLIQGLENENQQVMDQYLETLKRARGFSPALIVDSLDPEPTLHTTYPDGAVILFSGLIGLMLYLVFFFIREESRDRK